MKRSLFGGAISCDVPSGFADVSEFRQVPDNQEVFADAVTDRCVIIELLQMEETIGESATGTFYFNEIADSNACAPTDRHVAQAFTMPASEVHGLQVPAHIAVGTQAVAKYKEAAKNVIQVYVCCLRLPRATTDLVVSVTVPISVDPNSSSRGHIPTDVDEGSVFLKAIFRSLAVHDWDLFQ
ncbi:hypothetical protein SDRG_10563 [Saprolegnia diclina VS20]|uniref:Ran guanine nucleotide release factor n=1 Tax=Saprolegnia diclina (strain VS20) TaxID=1156394 RepID=T0Q1P9_SAPDV|nr:hypothetical protein SDRG_10563 [Saprolegnia diclina VS20]EQC31774.1 hypothetical protein SDRG_10563 [Saprolegnia diclina VS20]|eukprot:XP_008614781.1 hypothetical protein SDRG_10563 [Saprolegnia diclina VS20]